MKDIGSLFVIATPIGNYDDITIRALNTLKSVDVIICEEFREGTTLLKKLDIPKKELVLLNEHNEKEQVPEILNRLLQGENFGLISDCGTPVFADPGHYLIEQTTMFNIPVLPIPGASSLMATLSVLNFKLDKFYFAGFLPREKNERKKSLEYLRTLNIPIILMDTPYRLTKLLDEISRTFGKNRQITLAVNITMENEQYYRGTIAEVISALTLTKAEFMLVVHGY
jgi:16S rRNA (cytidine1402-2'-O)-methyltransferase